MAGARRTLLALTLLATALSAPSARADESSASLEYPVKASLLLNFAKFAEWPSSSSQAASQAVAICILGHDPFGRLLDAVIADRTVGGRAVEIRRYRQIEGIESCHVLFVASPEMPRLAQVLARIGDAPVLTVGEADDFIERGGLIQLRVENNRARFSVNLGPTETNHLKLSSKLLSVAHSVRVGANR